MNEKEKTYTVAETARILGLKSGVVYRMYRLGQLAGAYKLNPYAKTKSAVAIPQEAIDRVLADRAKTASGGE